MEFNEARGVAVTEQVLITYDLHYVRQPDRKRRERVCVYVVAWLVEKEEKESVCACVCVCVCVCVQHRRIQVFTAAAAEASLLLITFVPVREKIFAAAATDERTNEPRFALINARLLH